MATLLALVGCILSVVLLWSGIKRFDISGYGKAAISFLELLVLAASVILLGSVGLVLFALANSLAALATGVRLAMVKEEKLVYAATQCGATKEEM